MSYIPKYILQTQIDITNMCNLKCIHCRANANTIKEELTYEEFVKIVNDLKENGVKRLTISGGEPFLNKDIYKILDYLKEKQSLFDYIGVTSNGYTYNQTFFDKILSYKDFIHLQISIDGFKEKHNLNRGINNAFEKTISNIKKLIEIGVHISTSTTINLNNIHTIESLIEYLISIGVKNISFRHEIPSGRSNIHIDYEFKKKYLKLLTKYFCRFKNEFLGINFSCGDPIKLMVDSEFLKGEKIEDIISGNIIGGCSVGIVSMYIGSNGIVNGCPYLNETVGTLSNGIGKLWNDNKIFGKFRNRESLKGNCGQCKWKHICGGCRAVAKNSGDILGGDKFCLFGFNDFTVFSHYLTTNGLSDKIEEFSLTNFNGSNYVPFWCQAILKLEGKNNINDILKSNWAKRDIKKIYKNGYTHMISELEEDLIYFYKFMYLDYSLSKYAENEIIIMPYFFLYDIFKKNGKILFILDKEGNRIGGYLLSQKSEGYYIATSMGIDLSKVNNDNNFISSALYYFMIQWSIDNNLQKISFGKTRLYKEDGILKFKIKWGVNSLEHEKKGIYIKFKDGVNIGNLFYL